jgi:uncharacterized protein (DUF433 family)
MSIIVKTAGVCAGRARINGTRIAVWLIQAWTKKGMSSDDLLVEYPFLSEEGIQAALQYANENKEEIEFDIEENERDDGK